MSNKSTRAFVWEEEASRRGGAEEEKPVELMWWRLEGVQGLRLDLRRQDRGTLEEGWEEAGSGEAEEGKMDEAA